MQLLRSERENFQSKLEAERHIARARVRDLMEKHEAELLRAANKHKAEMSEKEQALRRQLETLQRSISLPADASANQSTCITAQRVTDLQGSQLCHILTECHLQFDLCFSNDLKPRSHPIPVTLLV